MDYTKELVPTPTDPTRSRALEENEIANLLASKFIARKDAKAQQYGDGIWMVHTKTGKRDGERIPWRRADLLSHVRGDQTFGHYLLDESSSCKLIAFDVDLTKTGHLPVAWTESDELGEEEDLREAWLNRRHPARGFIKYQFKLMANMLMSSCSAMLGAPPLAAAYSGGKGIHVYAFTGLIPAQDARDGAGIVLDNIGGFKATRGENFFVHEQFPILSIELFPKQGSLDGKDLGNLMRLPLGKNMKAPREPTFFIDMTSPVAEMVPTDPIKALTAENPWE